MPRTTKTSQKAGPSQKSKNKTLSQATLEQSFSNSQKVIENLDELVNNCVRYVVYRAGSNLPIRKLDIQKHVLQNVGKNIDQIMNKVIATVKNVYGYDLYLSDEESSTKQFLVSNALPYKGTNTQSNDNDEEIEIPSDVNKILIMLVLSHIFMSNDNASEASLFMFLRAVQIDPDERHDLFGNVKDFVTSVMVKQKYLCTTVDSVTHKVTYSWGARSEHEISKHAILKFVCKMYKDRKPTTWTSQFESANAQAEETGVDDVDLNMTDDDD